MIKKHYFAFPLIFLCLGFYSSDEPVTEFLDVSPLVEKSSASNSSFEEVVYFLPGIAISLLDGSEDDSGWFQH